MVQPKAGGIKTKIVGMTTKILKILILGVQTGAAHLKQIKITMVGITQL